MIRSPVMTAGQRRRLTAVARGEAPADLYVRGGTLLNVYTGELYRANVAVAGERIAYVGERDDMVGPRTTTLPAEGRILVPGYIDPHVHPAHVVTPSSLARHLLPLGTTTVFADTLQIWELGGRRAFETVAGALARSPLKFYWMVRVHAQTRSLDEPARYPVRALARALAHPWTLAAGEVTRWPDVWGGDRDLLARLDLALARGQRVEGHTAGASGDKLAAIAAGGLTSDHEAITAREVLERARQGIGVMLRESSLRPDLAGLLDALKEAPALVSRLMLTADGSMPAFIRDHGFVDHLIRTALERGVAPIDAYRMATLNPATYMGRDGDVGGIAPGRYADVCLLRDLAEPRPAVVVARGRVAARDGRALVDVPEPDWRRAFSTPSARLAVTWRARPEDFRLPARATYPVIRLASAVITRLEERAPAEGDLFAALVDRAGRWVAPALVAGFGEGVDGLASTITTDFNILVLGRRRAAMARAVNRLLDVRGGVVLVDGERVALEWPLPLGGVMTRLGVPEAAAREDALRAALVARGYPHHEPLFTLFFLAADFLPFVRLSPRGVWDVKQGRVLLPRRARRS
ncbi:MAG TPA: adenine deaminase C-terminal domain-containing protein [Candidatus Binatia bacterium]|nr:adenine deaminase C-terminal domain-containing protein [Candidatus Binatia bacterium]